MKLMDLYERACEYKTLQKNKIPLEQEERDEAMKAKAVWHFSHHKGKPSCAIWKSKRANGDIVYGCNTHRAYNTAPTLKGAIHKFHSFIKGTA